MHTTKLVAVGRDLSRRDRSAQASASLGVSYPVSTLRVVEMIGLEHSPRRVCRRYLTVLYAAVLQYRIISCSTWRLSSAKKVRLYGNL